MNQFIKCVELDTCNIVLLNPSAIKLIRWINNKKKSYIVVDFQGNCYECSASELTEHLKNINLARLDICDVIFCE